MYARIQQVEIHITIIVPFLLGYVWYFSSDDSQPKNQVPVLRALANLFAQEAGTSVILIHWKWVRCCLMLMLNDDLWLVDK